MFELLGYPIQHIGITRLLARRWMREYHDMHLADINNDDDYSATICAFVPFVPFVK